MLADRGYQGAGRGWPGIRVPQRSRRPDRTSAKLRPLSAGRRAVNLAHAQLKSWRVLRKIRSSPSRASELVAAVQILTLAG